MALAAGALALLSQPCKDHRCPRAKMHFVFEVMKTEGDLAGKVKVGDTLVEHRKPRLPVVKREILWLDEKPNAEGKHDFHAGTYYMRLVEVVPIQRPVKKERR